MIPFVRNDALWRSGLAGAIPGVTCFALAGIFLFAAARRVFSDTTAAACTLALFALNPNLLYVQSIPMTESAFFFSLCGLLYCTVAFAGSQSAWLPFCAGLFSIAGLHDALRRMVADSFRHAVLLCPHPRASLAERACLRGSGGPRSAVLACNNWYCCGDMLEFYRGRYSALGIQGSTPYPGQHNWNVAWIYFRAAATLVAGRPLGWIGAMGVARRCSGGRYGR